MKTVNKPNDREKTMKNPETGFSLFERVHDYLVSGQR
jgi:hypothetical protein